MTIYVIVENWVKTIHTQVTIRYSLSGKRICQSEALVNCVIIWGGLSVNFRVNIEGSASFDDIFVSGWHNNNGCCVWSKLIGRTLETDHRRVTGVKPVQVSQGASQINLELNVATVTHMVGNAKLHRIWTKNTCWCKSI